VDQGDGTRERLEAASNHTRIDLIQPSLVALGVELDAQVFGDAAYVAVLTHPDEGLEIVRRDGVPFLGKQLDRRLRQGRFGHHEHAVHVENDCLQLTGFQERQIDARAIVFDLDGVLVDTMPAIRAAWAEWARTRGIPANVVLAEIHLTAGELIRKFAPTLDSVAEARRIAARQGTLHTSVVAFEGAHELIAGLALDSWAIVTSARREPALHHLAMAGLPAPKTLISADDTPRGKPDPEGYKLAAERLGLPPSACLAIEDSPAGVRAARDAGMAVLGVTNTYEASKLSEANGVIPSLAQIDVTSEPLQDLRWMRIRWKHGIEAPDRAESPG